MARSQLVSASYPYLFREIKTAFTQGLLSAKKALEYQRLKTYWTIGRCVEQAVKKSKGSLTYGQGLYIKISDDLKEELNLDISTDMLGRMVQFYKSYPRFPQKTTLTFSHYIVLQRVKDIAQRARLEAYAIKHDLTALDLKEKLVHQGLEKSLPSALSSAVLELTRGEPYIYYIRPERTICGNQFFRIDCGFNITYKVSSNSMFHPDQSRVIRSIKTKGQYTVEQYKQGKDKLYTYAAVVTRVIDGDTFDAWVDVGFGVGHHARFRLRGIDAPEISTSLGRASRCFVERYLARCPVIVIRSYKTEKYGRWLADVFCLPSSRAKSSYQDPVAIAACGEYLNQILLTRGPAKLYR